MAEEGEESSGCPTAPQSQSPHFLQDVIFHGKFEVSVKTGSLKEPVGEIENEILAFSLQMMLH
jgi:hypothetical protein